MSSVDENKDKRPSENEVPPTASFPGLLKGESAKIGHYKLLGILGEGGFAKVYLAEQNQPVKRRVALKVIKPGMDTKQVIARFEAERQALAILDHPNIAQVYDAGTTEAGRPYFVMEHVKGTAITQHCDEQKLSIEERLDLFIQVCDGVQHAHQKGIIHRDIKPSNVLAVIEGKKAVPKIIDFGVAKALTQPLTERTLYTELGQLIGTPEYMSPEQADVNAQDIDTRSDVYSLGVLLYELLAGVLPFNRKTLERAGFAEIQRIIREVDPPHPSTRLSSLGEEARKVAASRCTEVAALAKRLRKELEWIPLKAMRKERSHRYRSASELADDIQNYLRSAPLIAGPESVAYRIKKLVRRNRAFVTGAVAVLAVLVAGVIISTSFAVSASRQYGLAQQRAADAAAGLLPMDTLAGVLVRQGRYDEAEQLYETVRDISERLFGKEQPTTVFSMGCLASFYSGRNRYKEAEQLLDELVPLSKRVLGVQDIDTLRFMSILANLHARQGRYDKADRLYVQVWEGMRHTKGQDHPETQQYVQQVIQFYKGLGQPEKAEQWRTKLPSKEVAEER